MLLDVAHDSEAIYHQMDHQNIEPFIDLNSHSKKNTKTGGIEFISKSKEFRKESRIKEILAERGEHPGLVE